MSQINTRIILRNDLAAAWKAKENEITLMAGEFGVETDTGLFKIGKTKEDGSLFSWAELAYANDVSEIAALLAKDEALDKDIADLRAADLTINSSLSAINALLENVYLKSEVYNKNEIDNTINTINNTLIKKLEAIDLVDYAKTTDVVLKSVYEQYVFDTNKTIEANTAALTTLIGDDINKSIRAIAQDELNILIKASDPDGGKTIEQIADLVKYVDENAGDIANLIAQTDRNSAVLANIGEGEEYTTVLSAIEGKIKAATYILSVATGENLGGVLSAVDIDNKPIANSVYVNDTGIMTVKKVTTDILTNGAIELVLNGGNATGKANA